MPATDVGIGSAAGGVHVAEDDRLLLQVEVVPAWFDGHGRADGAFDGFVVKGMAQRAAQIGREFLTQA